MDFLILKMKYVCFILYSHFKHSSLLTLETCAKQLSCQSATIKFIEFKYQSFFFFATILLNLFYLLSFLLSFLLFVINYLFKTLIY